MMILLQIIALDYFYQNRHYLRLLIKNQKFYLLLEKFNRVAVRIYQSIDAPWHIKAKTPLELTDSLLFIVDGYSNIISSWLTEKIRVIHKKLQNTLTIYLSMFHGI